MSLVYDKQQYFCLIGLQCPWLLVIESMGVGKSRVLDYKHDTTPVNSSLSLSAMNSTLGRVHCALHVLLLFVTFAKFLHCQLMSVLILHHTHQIVSTVFEEIVVSIKIHVQV